eukprot:scaffold1932_cov162-Isochrysis_galbana.AAC.3
MPSRPVARRRKRYSGSSSGAGDGTAHEDLGAYAAVAALVRARCMAESQESQESTEMDMVPGPEVVRTLSFVDQLEALVGAARVGNPTVGQGATCGAEGRSNGRALTTCTGCAVGEFKIGRSGVRRSSALGPDRLGHDARAFRLGTRTKFKPPVLWLTNMEARPHNSIYPSPSPAPRQPSGGRGHAAKRRLQKQKKVSPRPGPGP